MPTLLFCILFLCGIRINYYGGEFLSGMLKAILMKELSCSGSSLDL